MNSTNLLLALKHDFHKTRGIRHKGDVVVPYAADKITSDMSRPRGNPKNKETTELARSDDNHYRICALTKERTYKPAKCDLQVISKQLNVLKVMNDPLELHKKILLDKLLSLFNESYFYPYTSLKYHTLLVTALVYNLSTGVNYDNLYLHITKPNDCYFTTIYRDDKIQLDIARKDYETDGKTKIPFKMDNGSIQAGYMWFGRSWNKLSEHLETNRYLDSLLRRIGSWSTALQLIEDWRDYHGY